MSPFSPKTDDPAEYWLWLREICAECRRVLPHGDSPQRIYWDHPDDKWKDDLQAREDEQEHAEAVRQFLRKFLTVPKVKLPSSSVLYCVRLRLEFAQRQAKLFATTCYERGRCPLEIPKGSHVDNLM
jgi:hypothetical protein